MRKSVVLILSCLLLLPALANAWTLVVTVNNGNDTNYVKLTSGALNTANENVAIKSAYSSPQITMSGDGEVTITGTTTNLTLDGAPVSATAGVLQIPAPASNSAYVQLVATFDPASSTKKNINVLPVPGGLIVLKVGPAQTMAGFSLLPGTAYTVTAIPFGGYKVTGIFVDGGNVAQVGAVVGESRSASSTVGVATTDVSATFVQNASISGSANIPTNGVTGNAISLSSWVQTIPASSIAYTWTVTGPANFNGNASSLVFTPTAAGTYHVAFEADTTDGGNQKVQASGDIVVADAVALASAACTTCHSNSTPTVVANFNVSKISAAGLSCQTCHASAVLGVTNPHTNVTCVGCHNSDVASHTFANVSTTTAAIAVKNLHTAAEASCVGCHAVTRNFGASYVQDNNGVRAVVGEFGKWSHHVTGVDLQDAHCAACHMEGKTSADGARIVVDSTYHMAGKNIYLRNADTDAAIAWDPENPNFTNMDNFCMSCHDADGAISPKSAAIRALMIPATGKTASATNPFGDTISNQYDKMERPAVVNAKGQFDPANNSHHAVRGKRYTGNSRSAGSRQIASAATFAANSSATLFGARATIYDAGKFEATYRTLEDAAGETDSTQSLNGRNGGTALGDDSTLHCADCHTVGQFAARGTVAFANLSTNFGAGITKFYKEPIGAHGANNEYLLRNAIGTDARHTAVEYTSNGKTVQGVTVTGSGASRSFAFDGTKAYLVCFNCHNFMAYGSLYTATNKFSAAHAGEAAGANGECNGSYNTTTAINTTGEDRLKSIQTNGTQASYVQWDDNGPASFGNIYGIQCANCHNSGTSANNIYGGIHGSVDPTYTDGMGNTTKHERFLPGLGNVMYVPGTKGGFTGGSLATYKNYSANAAKTSYALLPVRNVLTTGTRTGSWTYTTGGVSSDLNWEQKLQFDSVTEIGGGTSMAAGCYTLSPTNTKVKNFLQANGYPADDVRYAASNNLKAPDGTVMFDNWGGCDDHNEAAGSSRHTTKRGVVRPVTY